MAKYKLDDILSELGMADADAAPAKRKHAIDRESNALAPVPMSPAHQGPPPRVEPPAAPTAEVVPPGEPVVPQASLEPSGLKAAVPPANSGPVGDQSLEAELETLLIANGVSEDSVANARQLVKQSPMKKFTEALLEAGIEEPVVQAAVAEVAGIGFERINLEKGLEGGFDGRLLQRLTPEFCKENMVLPLRMEGQRPVIGATTDNVFLVDNIKERLGVPSIKLVLVTAYDIRGAMDMIGQGVAEEKSEDISSILEDVDETDVQVEKKQAEDTDLEKAAGQNPVIRLVNLIIQTAVKEGASDIHIEPAEKKLKVRYRIDGELTEILTPPASMSAAITSRLKIMANLDIAERRLPQDGRIRCTVGGRRLDLRMSTLPCGYGEKTVMRILDSRSISVELNQLGFHDDQMVIWRKAIDAPHGINLVTGPTGSGKTTTLYASLRTLDKASMNICTVEDPIEYHLDGVTQSQMHEKIGMTFAAALRALLRQDPDVIMLGEIRDLETAHIAVQAALTGHLVLSTLHTNDAPSSITRLVNIGLEPFLVGAAVNAVLAQRLIRKLCVHCRAEEAPSDDMAEYLTMNGMSAEKIMVPKGCDKCRRSGFSGRVGIYELLSVDDQLRDIIARNPNVAEFRRLCIERGMVTLREDGMRKVGGGITSISEVLRVTEGH
jgi:type IV pilus assembly protein PilB